MSSQLVDLHCHILPGIDDGAKNLDVSMSLIPVSYTHLRAHET